MKILIIDDDADMRRGLGTRLRAKGYDIAFASDAVLAGTIAIKEKPDLVLLDLGLPGGDGLIVLQRLQRMASMCGIPIIIVSARDSVKNEQQCLAAGAFGYFQKPVDIDRLMAAINGALGAGEGV
jgi:DNA-binding response OmpR family regulator